MTHPRSSARVHKGKPQWAATLFAASQAARDWTEILLPAINRPDYERNLEAVREALGESVFTLTWENGKKIPLEKAVSLAMEDD
jgi:hypothetical protein